MAKNSLLTNKARANRWLLFLVAAFHLFYPLILLTIALALSPVATTSTGARFTESLGIYASKVLTPDIRMALFVALIAATGALVSGFSTGAIRHPAWRRPNLQVAASGKTSPRYGNSAAGDVRASLLAQVLRSFEGAVVGVIAYALLLFAVIAPAVGVSGVNPIGMTVLGFGIGLAARTIVSRVIGQVTSIVTDDAAVLQAIDRLQLSFESSLADPPLEYFDGSIVVQVFDEGKRILPFANADGLVHRLTSRACTVIVFFCPEKSVAEKDGLAEQLAIPNGVRKEYVTFDCALEAGTTKVADSSMTVTFRPGSISETMQFLVDLPSAQLSSREEDSPISARPEIHTVYFEVSQKQRLLQSIAIHLQSMADR